MSPLDELVEYGTDTGEVRINVELEPQEVASGRHFVSWRAGDLSGSAWAEDGCLTLRLPVYVFDQRRLVEVELPQRRSSDVVMPWTQLPDVKKACFWAQRLNGRPVLKRAETIRVAPSQSRMQRAWL